MKNKKNLFLDTKKFNLMLERMDSKYTLNETEEKIRKLSLLTEGFPKAALELLTGLGKVSDELSVFIRAVGNDITSIRALMSDIRQFDEAATYLKSIEDEITAVLKAEGKTISKFQRDGLDKIYAAIKAVDDVKAGKTKNTVTGMLENTPKGSSYDTISRDIKEFAEDAPEFFNEGMPDGQKIKPDEVLDDVKIKNLVRKNVPFVDVSTYKNIIGDLASNKWSKYTPADVLMTKEGKKLNGYIIYNRKNNYTVFIDRKDFPEMSGYFEKNPDFDAPLDTKKPLADQPGGRDWAIALGQYQPVFRQRKNYFAIIFDKIKKYRNWYLIPAGVNLVALVADCIWSTYDTTYTVTIKGTGKKVTYTYDLWECIFPAFLKPAPYFHNSDKMGITWLDVILGPVGVVTWFVRKVDVDIVDYSKFFDSVDVIVKNEVYDLEMGLLENLSIVEILQQSCSANASEILQKVANDSGLGADAQTIDTMLGLVGIEVDLTDDFINESIEKMANTYEEAQQIKENLKEQSKRVKAHVEGIPKDHKFYVDKCDIAAEAKKVCFLAKVDAIVQKMKAIQSQQKLWDQDKNKIGDEACFVTEGMIDLYTENGYKDNNTPTTVQACKDNKTDLGILFQLKENITEGKFKNPGTDWITCSKDNLDLIKSNMETCEEIEKQKNKLKNELDLTIEIEVENATVNPELPKDDYKWESYVVEGDDKNICYVCNQNMSSNKELLILAGIRKSNDEDFKPTLKEGKDYKIVEGQPLFKFNDFNISTMANYQWCKGNINKQKTQQECVNDLITKLKSVGCWDNYWE